MAAEIRLGRISPLRHPRRSDREGAVGAGGDGVWEAAVVGAILAPTDASLGQAVISNPRVPLRIRLALNVESGLNDGIVVPVALIFLGAAEESELGGSIGSLLGFIGQEVLVAGVVGVAIILAGVVIEDAAIAGAETIVTVAMVTVTLSVFAHGLTAWNGSESYADWADKTHATPGEDTGETAPKLNILERFQSPGMTTTTEPDATP